MLAILIILLLGILGVCFILNEKELTAPSFVFLLPFILALFIAFSFRERWNLNLELNTFCVLLFGSMSFVAGTQAINKKNSYILNDVEEIQYNLVVVKKQKLIVLTFFQLAVLFLTYMAILEGETGNLSTILGRVRSGNVNSGKTNFPFYLSFMNSLSLIIGIICTVLIAQAIIYTQKKCNILLVSINFLLSIVISFFSGSRGVALILLFSFLCNMLMLGSNKNKWKKNIPLKYAVTILIIFIFIFINFQNISVLLGQKHIVKIDFATYMSTYMGAQIKNLDDALNVNGITRSHIFGQETFRSWVQIFAKLIGNTEWSSYSLTLPFNRYNGIGLGNVYTTFYPYIEDFGYVGVIVLPFIMGTVSQLFYMNAKIHNQKSALNLWNIMWSFSFYCLFFSFFSNKFYELIVSVSMIKYIICIHIILWFMFGIHLGKRRVVFRFKP